jgi:hypothetical protein
MVSERRWRALGALVAILILPSVALSLYAGYRLTKIYPETFGLVGGVALALVACLVSVVILWYLLGMFFDPNRGKLLPFCLGKPKTGYIAAAPEVPALTANDVSATELPTCVRYSVNGLLQSAIDGTLSRYALLDCPDGTPIGEEELGLVIVAAEAHRLAGGELLVITGGGVQRVFEMMENGPFKLFSAEAYALRYVREMSGVHSGQ